MMEEDVEIELLYKAHGHMLMEAAATEHVEDEERISRICGEISEKKQLINVERAPNSTVSSKKYSRGKLKRKKKLVRKKYDSKKNNVVDHDESSTDVELLLDSQILTCFLNDKIKATNESDYEMNTSYGRNNESENCINKLLNDEFKLEKINSELVETQVESNCSRSSFDKCIIELKSLQNIIDKREDLLLKLEKKLKEELIENESKLRQVREAKNALTLNETSKIKQPDLSKFCFKKFGMPYFHDSSDFPAPPNDDVKKKLKNDELIITDLPKIRYWKKASKDKLQDAIQLTLINENSDKFVKEIEKLQCMLTNVTDEQTEKEILNRLSEFQNQLRATKSKSYLELLANENPDREYDWLKYSASDLNVLHSPEECKRFWHLYLKPAINKSRWERSEDEKLKKIAEKMNFEDWESIAQSLGTNRTAYQCLIHYRNRLFENQELSVGKWTKEEDEKLLNVIHSSKIGEYIPWTKVASFMSDRNHNQVYNRYSNCLNPKLIKGKFSKEEDLLILSGIQVCGVTFKEMASLMENRTSSQIRERYERHLLPKTAKTGTFSLEEDEQLLKLIDKHGERNFALVADEMKTRSRTQVRQRYNFILQMMKTKPGWTPSQVKRRSICKNTSSLIKTYKQVEKLRKEIEGVEKSLQLTKLQSETFRIEKLKELRDSILVKKYDLTKFKRKTSPKNSVINNQLLEFFKYYHLNNPVKSSVCKNSVDNAAYLNEIILLAKYFGHDLQLPTSEEEIWENQHLNHKMKTFLVQTLKQQAVNAASNKKKSTEASTVSVEEPHKIDYVEPEVENTLMMEECWHNVSVNVSNLNFSEFFKRTVFDYSNGMHKDIWDSKMKRSKSAMFNCTDSIDSIDFTNTKTHQQYFFPPNSLTTLGFKSILLSRTRLKQDTRKLLKDQVQIVTRKSPTYRAKDIFEETLLSLFYCPKVLSVTDIGSTLLPNIRNKTSSSKDLKNHVGIVHLLNNSNQNVLDIVRKVTKPIKDDALQAKKIKMHMLEHNENRKRQLKEFKAGITFKRKMNIEHLAKNLKGVNKTSSNNQVKGNKKLKRTKKEYDSSFKVKKLVNCNNTFKTNDSQNTMDSPKIRFENEVFSSVPYVKESSVPVQSYTRTRQSLKRHLDSHKYSEPANKKLSVGITETSKSNQPTSPDANNLCLKKQTKVTTGLK